MRRWLSSLLLFCLLVSQQGLLLHGLGHSLAALDADSTTASTTAATTAASAPDEPHHQPLAGEVCATCLAFASLAGAVSADLAPPSLLATLSHTLAAAEPLAQRHAPLPAPRSRGPPTAA